MTINTVCLCGSAKFIDAFHQADVELTKRGLSVITISMAMPKNEQTADEAALKELLDLVHFNKILRADAVFIVGDGYIGRSTARQIMWAEMQSKPVIAKVDCESWDEAANRVRHRIVDTYIYPRARARLAELSAIAA